MQWSRVKSILIVILLLVDSFLLCMLGGKLLFTYRRGQELRAHMQTILASHGMKLSDSMDIPRSAMIPQLYIDRNCAAEAAVAAALLGGSAERSEEGELSRFTSAEGEVVWNEQGEMQAALRPADYEQPAAGQVRARAEQLLQNAGLTASGMMWSIDGNQATARFKTAGYEVFGRSMTVMFENDCVSIAGRWTFDTPYSTKSNLYASYNPSDALIVFAGLGLASRVDSMEPGLKLTNAAGNQFALTPVWRIVTENGEYFVDPLKKVIV